MGLLFTNNNNNNNGTDDTSTNNYYNYYGIISTSAIINVNCSPDILLLTISDIQSLPIYNINIKKVYINPINNIITNDKDNTSSDTENNNNNTNNNTNNFNVGFSWNEIRTIRGREHIICKTITSIETNIISNNNHDNIENQKDLEQQNEYVNENNESILHEQKQIRIHSIFPTANMHKNATNTTTLIIDSCINNNKKNKNNCNNNKCTLIGTVAVLPNNVLYQILLIIFGNYIIKYKINILFYNDLNCIVKEAERRYNNNNNNNQLIQQQLQQQVKNN